MLPTQLGEVIARAPKLVMKSLLTRAGLFVITAVLLSGAMATLAVSVVLMYAVKATGTLRVSAEGELEGLDLHEHGMVAYPEFVIHHGSSGPSHS